MKRRILFFLAVFILSINLAGCQATVKNEYIKYNDSFFDTFDTMTQVVGYARSEEEFKSYFEKIHSRFFQLHKLYDIYNEYDGINNVKTINDNAGIKPVKVDKEIIDLIVFAIDWDKRTGGLTNIAMGPVLSIWHDYREAGKDDPENAKLPPLEDLVKASKYTDIDKVIVDKINSTVYLEDKYMSLDVGAIAKGFATEVVAKEIMTAGFDSGIISAGGNVRVLGKPFDGIRERWGIGIQNPDKLIVTAEENLLDTVFVNNVSVVSSGDYQRYYIVDNKVIHHLINPKTLMPGDYYRAITVVAENSGLADFLSTTLFLLPYNQSRKLADSLNDVNVVWVMKDGKIEATDGMKKIMKSKGATGAKAE